MANQPNIIPMPWAASNTVSGTIPETTVEAGKASWAQGFPIETGIPLTQGGIPPKYSDFNAILKILSEFAIFAQAGGQYAWSNQIDYSVGALVLGTDGYVYRCVIVNGPSSAVRNPVGDTTGRWEKIISQSDIAALQAQVDGATSAATIAQSAATDAQTAVTALNGAVVKTTGNQSVAGTKTYTGSAVFSGGATFASGLTASGGITITSSGASVSIPAAASNHSKFLRGDGQWADIGGGSAVTYAASAGIAEKVGSSTVGTSATPVYISAGKPVAVTAIASATNAASATTAATAASCTGNAATATSAASAGVATKIGTATVGTSTKPVYISSGIPVSMAVVASATNATNAASATSAASATIAASAGVATVVENTGTNPTRIQAQYNGTTKFVQVNPVTGNAGVNTNLAPISNGIHTLGLSNTRWSVVYASTFSGTATSALSAATAASCTGNAATATTATTATTASKLAVNAGASGYPVYFSGGIPVSMGAVVSATNATNAAVATKLGTANKGSVGAPIYLSSGTPVSMSYVNSATNASYADEAGEAAKLGTQTVGANGKPVFFSNGYPYSMAVVSSATTATNATSLGGSAASVYAKDSLVLHKSGAEIVTGAKTFSGGMTVPVSSGASSMSGGITLAITSGATTRNTGIPATLPANWKKYLRGDGEWAEVNGYANVKDFGAVGDGTTDDTDAIQAAIATKKDVYLPKGKYVVTDELTFITQGQKMFGDGRGYGRPKAGWQELKPEFDWADTTTILFKNPRNSGVRYVKTRYLYNYGTEANPISPATPLDPAMSAGINVQAENVTISDLCVRLFVDQQYRDVDWDGTAATRNATMGADWDIGIFVGTRLEFQLRNVAVIGFFRKACIWIDVTHGGTSQATSYPRFVDYRTGIAFPNIKAQTGGDGTYFENVTTHGGRWGVRVQGGEPKSPAHVTSDRPNIRVKRNALNDPTGENVTGVTRADTRGAYGFSDFVMLGCEIFGGVHSTRRRYANFPSGLDAETLKTNLATNASYLELGGAFLMSGISGNGSDVLRGHRYIGCRFACGAPFTILINYSGRDTFIGCHGEDTAFIEGYKTETTDPYEVSPSAANSFGILCLTSNHLAYKNISSVVPLYDDYYDYKYPDTTVGAEYTGNYKYRVNLAGLEMRLSMRNGQGNDRASHLNYGTYNGLTWYPETIGATEQNPTGTPQYLRFKFSNYDFLDQAGIELASLFASGTFRVGGNMYSTSDDATLGTENHRWANIYAQTSTIGTSDARLKENVIEPDEALMRAWGRVRFKLFQFSNAVSEKGAKLARIHVGVIAQEVQQAFADEGLDVSRYGLFCHDVWDDKFEETEVVDIPAIVDEAGNVTTPAKTHKERRQTQVAGDAYGLRYEEALALECAYQRWRLDRLEKALGVSNA